MCAERKQRRRAYLKKSKLESILQPALAALAWRTQLLHRRRDGAQLNFADSDRGVPLPRPPAGDQERSRRARGAACHGMDLPSVCYQGLITLEEGTITEGLIWFRVESYHVVAADGKIFWLSAAPT